MNPDYKLYKRIEYTTDNLTDKQYLEISENPFILKDYLDNEKKYLEEHQIKVIEVNVDSLYIIVENSPKLHHNLYVGLSILHIKEVNNQGKLVDKIEEKKESILNNVKLSKIEFIKEFFKENEIIISKVKENVGRAGIIEFNCFVCKKTNSKCYMMLDSFLIFTHSKTDCVDEKHQRAFKTLTTKLRQAWKKREKKEIGEYTLNLTEIKETIKESFPLIYKDKVSNKLYVYNEDLKYYVELQEKKNRNDLNTLIRNSFYIEQFNELFGLTVKQLNDIKNLIKDQILLNYKRPNPHDYLNLENGIYDIQNKILLPHSSDFFFTYKLPVKYQENIDTSWLDNLIKSWDLNITIIKKYLGYNAQSSTKEEKLFNLVGEGGTGKGTFIKFMLYILNNRIISMDIEQLYESFQSIPYNKSVENATCIIDTDVQADFFLKHSPKKLIKMSSGEGLEINIKFGDKYYIETNRAKITIITNEPLKVNSTFDNGGYDRRIFQIEFKRNWDYSKKDTNLLDDFKNDDNKKSQFLSYILQGLEMFYNQKLGEIFFPIDKVKELERKKEVEPLIEFLDDNYIKTNNWDNIIKFSDIMNKYEEFRCENKYRYSLTARTLKNKIHEFFDIDKKYINYTVSIKNEKVKGVRYLKLKPDRSLDLPPKDNNLLEFENENRPKKEDL